ncbi:hypothetical protein [Mediterraneibacter gnavus]|uniref:hypothetical protein n=1 Tax=Mediterraneibacter gnavus TaxID=33038 RepID=UPI00366FC77D
MIRKVYKKIKSAYELYEEKEEMLQKALEQIDRYPEWRQQSIDIQAEFLEKIQSLSDNQKECVKRLERIEESNRKRELNKAYAKLLQSHKYFTDKKKNPLQAWTKMESDSFWNIFGDYEEAGGNGQMHTEVQPDMVKLRVIQMDDTDAIAELYASRAI